MKNQAHSKGNANLQGSETSDRNFVNQKETKQQAGISNSGSQRSDQTSGRDAKPQSKKALL